MKFRAIDGEGSTDANGIHRYVLLSVGDVSLLINDGKNRLCETCTLVIQENMISVPAGSHNVSNYYHPSCYYRTHRGNRR